MRAVPLGLAGVLALAAVTAGRAQPPPDAVLATVAGTTITVADLEREMAARSAGQAGAFATVEQRRELLDVLVRQRSLQAAARAAGYDRDPEVVAVAERMMVARLRQDRLDPRLARVEVTDQEVAAYYQAHQAEYAQPERVRAAMVFIAVPANASAEKRAELEQRAETALAEARALPAGTSHFGPVARAYSDDRASRYQGGVMGWLVKRPGHTYRWEPEVVEAVFALAQPGDIGPLVKTEKGIYLVRLVDREGATARPLELLADGIRNRLLRERREQLEQAFLAEVTAATPVAVNSALLATVAPPAPAGGTATEPPPLPAD